MIYSRWGINQEHIDCSAFPIELIEADVRHA